MPQSHKEKLKVLVVHEINYREKVIYEIHEFPELLAAAGHEVDFLEFAEGYQGKPGRNERSWIQSGRVYKNARLRLHSPWLSGVESLDRIVALFTVVPILWRLRASKFDVVLNFAVPTFGLQVLLFGLITKTPVVHRALDVSHKIRKSLWNPAIELAERVVFNCATAVSANNPAMADYVKSRLSRKIPVTVNLPPSLSPGMEPAAFDKSLAGQLGINQDDFVVAYLGSFFYFSGLDVLLRQFADERRRNPRLRMLLIGGGEQEQELRAICASNDLGGSVVFTGVINFTEIPRYLGLADVGINPMEVASVSNFALPNKVLQYLALGLPVVSTKLLGLQSALGEGLPVVWVNSPSDVLGAAVAMASSRNEFPLPQVKSMMNEFAPHVALEGLLRTLRSQIKNKTPKPPFSE